MDHLWVTGSGDVSTVHRVVGKRRRITPNTVQSTLKRLHEKGLLRREKVSHAFVYSPSTPRTDFQLQTLQGVLRMLALGKPDAMLRVFVDLTERAGLEHLERLEHLVARRLKESGRGE